MSVVRIFFVPICVNCVYCVNCTKFGQLILRIVIKIDATRCQIFRLKCTKIVSAWLRPRPHWGRLRRSPRPPSRLGRDRRLGRLHSRDFGTRLGFAVPSLCPWRRLFVCVYCVNCTKFGQLILRIIIEIDATRCQIFRLKCTKIVFGWGSAPDPTGGAHSTLPDPLAGLKGPYF